MELGRGYKAKNGSKMKHLHGGRIGMNSDTVLVIKIPDAQVLRIMSRSLFLAMVLAALPFLVSILRGFSSISHSEVSGFETAPGFINVELFNSILRDLAGEGLLKKDDKALIISPPNGFESVNLLKNNRIDTVMDSDFERQSLFPDESYDFVFTSTSEVAKFADRILKIDGILALALSINPLNAAYREQSSYEVVYLRRYGSIIGALRKTGSANKLAVDSSPRRKLCQFATETKTVALRGLEDVLLEPPREPFAKSKTYLKIKFQPDLLGDSLEGYKRRVFIDVGLPEENKHVIGWFEQNYPKRNTKFEIHSLLAAPADAVVHHTDVSVWLSKHVKEEEYVVMKSEAEAVEEMITERTICLMDELFLACKNEWWQTEKRKKSSGTGRAHWECLALYGRLRDEGVAVHQRWG